MRGGADGRKIQDVVFSISKLMGFMGHKMQLLN